MYLRLTNTPELLDFVWTRNNLELQNIVIVTFTCHKIASLQSWEKSYQNMMKAQLHIFEVVYLCS